MTAVLGADAPSVSGREITLWAVARTLTHHSRLPWGSRSATFGWILGGCVATPKFQTAFGARSRAALAAACVSLGACSTLLDLDALERADCVQDCAESGGLTAGGTASSGASASKSGAGGSAATSAGTQGSGGTSTTGGTGDGASTSGG